MATAHDVADLKRALAAYVKPEILCIDELGYLPIDKFGADRLFQIVQRKLNTISLGLLQWKYISGTVPCAL